MAEETSRSRWDWLRMLGQPIFWALTAVAIFAFVFQIIAPDPYIENQQQFRAWLVQYEPFDVPLFIGAQALQVVIAPISHYTVGMIGGFMYGPALGGFYNYIGRMIGHIAAFWLARRFLRGWIRKIFGAESFAKYERFVVGTEKTLWIRIVILFWMIFLPFFPDDELSYLVGIGGMKFRHYLPVLVLGHLGGSWALAYIGAGKMQDPVFYGLLGIAVVGSIILAIYVRKLSTQR